MNKLERLGQSKLNERHFRFDANEYTVYVEGNIDILFWNGIFPQKDNWKPKITILKDKNGRVIGGWENLIKYLENHINKNVKINYILALDGDYSTILKNRKIYNYVVMTKKYNFENYIFCPISLNMCIKKLSLGCFDNEELVHKKIENFADMIKKLIILDIISQKNDIGIKDYGIENRHLIDAFVLKNRIKYITSINEYKKLIKENSNILNGYDVKDFIRWKCFIKQLGIIINKKANFYIDIENDNRRKNNSNYDKVRNIKPVRAEEGLYMYCIDNCKLCSKMCNDYKDLKKQAFEAFLKLSNFK